MLKNTDMNTPETKNSGSQLNVALLLFVTLLIINLLISLAGFVRVAVLILEGSSSPEMTMSVTISTMLIVITVIVLRLVLKRKRRAIVFSMIWIIVQLLSVGFSILNPYFLLMIVSIPQIFDSVAQSRSSFEAVLSVSSILFVVVNGLASVIFLGYFIFSKKLRDILID